MKVYVVTAGEYSDYHIERVFLDKDKAHRYSNVRYGMNVEEHDTDAEDKPIPAFFQIQYCPERNEISIIGEVDKCIKWFGQEKQIASERFTPWSHYFQFYTEATERLVADMEHHGNKSPLLLKIAQDRFAKYKAEHEGIT